MKNKSTLVLLGVVVLLGLYTYFFEFKKKEADEKVKTEQSKIYQLEKDQIVSFEIARENDPILVTKATDGWNLEKPIHDAAANEMADQFVTELIDDKSNRVAKEGADINWADYGLDKPLATFILKNNAGKSVAIKVSAQKDFEGNYFLRKDDENKVLVGSGLWLGRTGKTFSDFREKKVFRKKTADVDKVTIKNSQGEFTLVMKDTQWINEKHPDWKLDQTKVREAITGIGNMKALEFLDPSTTDKKTFGLASPTGHVSLFLKEAAQTNKPTWTVQIAKSKDNIFYGLVSEPNLVVKLDGFETGKVMNLSENGFRDGKLPFVLAAGDIKKIEYKGPRHDLALQQEAGGNWKIDKSPPEHESQQAKVVNLLTKVREAQVSHYLDSKTQNLFKSADRHLRLMSADGKDLLGLDWTAPIKLKLNGVDANVVLMKTTAFAEPFAMDEGTVKAWDVEQITQAKAEKPAAAAEPPPGGSPEATHPAGATPTGKDAP